MTSACTRRTEDLAGGAVLIARPFSGQKSLRTGKFFQVSPVACQPLERPQVPKMEASIWGIAGKVCSWKRRLLINAAGESRTLAAALVLPPRCPLKPRGSPRLPSRPVGIRSPLYRTRSKTLYCACLIRLETPYKGSNRKSEKPACTTKNGRW